MFLLSFTIHRGEKNILDTGDILERFECGLKLTMMGFDLSYKVELYLVNWHLPFIDV